MAANYPDDGHFWVDYGNRSPCARLDRRVWCQEPSLLDRDKTNAISGGSTAAALVDLGVADAKQLEKRSPIDQEFGGGQDRSPFLVVRLALNSNQFRQVDWQSHNRTRQPTD
jgi:hypothetical protein